MLVSNMDGEIHTSERDCCIILGRECRKCSGFEHGQPIYGGIMPSCENCDKEFWDEVEDEVLV